MAARQPRFNQQVLIDTTPLPDSIPKVQEIGASSAPLLSASFFIGARCKPYNDDFMLCKTEANGKGETECLKEGRKVTRCAASVIEDINKSCLDVFRTHWKCLDNNNQQLWQCRAAERQLNKCVFENLKLEKTIPGAPENETPVHLRKKQIYAHSLYALTTAMLYADGLEVALVRNNKDYNEKNVSQDHMDQSLRDRKGDRFPDDRRLAHYAAVHRQIRTDSDEVVKVAIRFDPKLFKMFTSDILQVKILEGKHTHTHHIGEPTGGFVQTEVLECLTAPKASHFPPDTIAVFITRGKFASDRKSSRKDLGFTPTASKNGHTYAFQFQCLPKGSPLATEPVPKPTSILAIRPFSREAEIQKRLTTPALPSAKARMTATSSTAMPSDAATGRNTPATVGRHFETASQTTIAFTATKRKATSENSAYSPSSDYDGGTVKKQKFSSQAQVADTQALDFATPVQTKLWRRSQDTNIAKQSGDIIDLTLDDSADEQGHPVKPVLLVQKDAEGLPAKSAFAANEDEQEMDAEDVLLELREVQLQRRLRAMQKKSRQGKVEENDIKRESA
ncbi:hypothetical protein TI39_contig285g00037 [Zymoseptoria brevis]|uniref:NADH-ubiquinone oxidoreductase n=1 Tax=Zymoseptoria brevis TaxID=1047168 RepID=A0A0F4GW14_9PEZI|nr:hypothetical protein TI39_contig285g00037 [Zymoseptoria brevis]